MLAGGEGALPAFAVRSADLSRRYIEVGTEVARDLLKAVHE